MNRPPFIRHMAGMLIFAVTMLFGFPSAKAEDFHAEAVTEYADGLFTVEVIRDAPTVPAGKRVLIYHTHTFEAYTQTQDAAYIETEKWRTTDSEHNMVAVGKALAVCLRAHGIEVVHDTSAFEPPDLSAAYERSLTMLEQRGANGEKYDMYLDLHRDAVASASSIKRTVNVGGEDIARFMVLVGQGTTGGYVEKPDWQNNLQIAQEITDNLNDCCSQLARDVKLKTGRFNQHIADCCLLIECGMNYNTLDEVLAGIPYLADAIAAVLCN